MADTLHPYYIAPDSKIYILKNVPLDNTYEHTIAWDYAQNSRKMQAQYFASKAKYTFDKQYYQREERGWLRIEKKADDLYDCNYIMFQNSAFGDKWFYAFITEVAYINNNTCQLSYEIDVMQTWLRGNYLDYFVEPCFVERSHTPTDRMFEHLVPEDIVNTDEYVVDEEIDFDMNDMSLVMGVSERIVGDEFVPATGKAISGVFGALDYYIWPCNTVAQLDTIMVYINKYIENGKENSILFLQMVPTVFKPGQEGTPQAVQPTYSVPKLLTPSPGQMLGGRGSGFFPKNNKLYTYPYNKIRVNNECGVVKDYKWELFTTSDVGRFFVQGTMAWQAGAVAYPANYRGISKNMEDAVTFECFPVCPWNSDAYKAWWAQNTVNMALSYGGAAVSLLALAGGAFTGNPALLAAGLGSLVSSGSKIAGSLWQANHRSPNTYGDNNTALLLPAMKNLRFVFTRESLRPEMLRLYDSYFSKYGYAIKRVISPPYINRERWTYVKTVGCEITGHINNYDSHKISEIYNNGITFWRNPDEVGRYDLPNNTL